MTIEQQFNRLNEIAPEPINGLAYYPEHNLPYCVYFKDGRETESAKTIGELESKLIELSNAELVKTQLAMTRLQHIATKCAEELAAK